MMELKNMKVAELKEMARGMHISGWWVMKKDQLIEAIENNRQTEEPVAEVETVVEEVVAEEPQVIAEEPVAEADVNTQTEEESAPEVKEVAQDDEPDEKVQRKNKKRLLDYNGKTQTLNAWAKELGIRHQTLYNRIVMKGMDVAEAFEMPIKKAALKGGNEQ